MVGELESHNDGLEVQNNRSDNVSLTRQMQIMMFRSSGRKDDMARKN